MSLVRERFESSMRRCLKPPPQSPSPGSRSIFGRNLHLIIRRKGKEEEPNDLDKPLGMNMCLGSYPGESINASIQRAEWLFKANGGLIRTRDAIKAGVHPRTMYEMRDASMSLPKGFHY